MAVVAHDDKGEIIIGWATHHHLGKPGNAEAEANLWLLKLAMAAKFNNIIVEGDAKVCFNDILLLIHVSWTISNVLNNVLELGKSFHFCSLTSKCTKFFNTLAKFSIPFRYHFYCNKSSIPRQWRQDVSFLALI